MSVRAPTRAEVFAGVAAWFRVRERRTVLKVLDPFGRAYYRLYAEVRQSLEALSDEQLRLIARAEELVTTTGCGWTEYAVAPMVADEAKSVLYARERREAVS